jgi:hypothetical protein
MERRIRYSRGIARSDPMEKKNGNPAKCGPKSSLLRERWNPSLAQN